MSVDIVIRIASSEMEANITLGRYWGQARLVILDDDESDIKASTSPNLDRERDREREEGKKTRKRKLLKRPQRASGLCDRGLQHRRHETGAIAFVS